MDFKKVAQDTTKVLISYLTYQAVRTVLNQLGETNPPLANWLNNFSSVSRLQNGEAYLKDLLEVNQELAFRIMAVREHLAEEILEFLPEMVQTGIQQANIEHRRQFLERITQLSVSDSATSPKPEQNSETNPDLPSE